MTEHGWERDDWPEIFERVIAADILVLGMPIWLGEKSSVATQIIERLYGNSHLLNDAGQYAYYGRTAGCLVTGNEDGVKHCAMNVLYSLQHLGYVIPPQADAGWIGEAGPGPSYLDPGSGGPENDFTNRNTTFATWNLLHMARMLKDAGGIPVTATSAPNGTPAAASTSPTRSTGADRSSARIGVWSVIAIPFVMPTEKDSDMSTQPGDTFPDLVAFDHAGRSRSLSELAAGDPLVLTTFRGFWCPRSRRSCRRLVAFQNEVEVAYTSIVSLERGSAGGGSGLPCRPRGALDLPRRSRSRAPGRARSA